MNFGFSQDKLEINLDKIGIRMDDLIGSYKQDPHTKKGTAMNRLTGERYRDELCQKLGITHKQLNQLFVAKLSNENKQKIRNLRGNTEKEIPVNLIPEFKPYIENTSHSLQSETEKSYDFKK